MSAGHSTGKTETWDLVVIGGGTAGIVAAKNTVPLT